MEDIETWLGDQVVGSRWGGAGEGDHVRTGEGGQARGSRLGGECEGEEERR